jgi:hypothetical protein
VWGDGKKTKARVQHHNDWQLHGDITVFGGVRATGLCDFWDLANARTQCCCKNPQQRRLSIQLVVTHSLFAGRWSFSYAPRFAAANG